MFALVFEREVIQIEAQEFPVASALAWIDILGVIPQPEVGWSFNGIVFTAPPAPSLPPTKEEIIDGEIARGEALSGLISEVADLKGVTDAQLVSDIKTRRGA